MPNCPTCGKPVYFGKPLVVTELLHALTSLVAAEKVSSLGKDWHRGCLKCAKCKKTLTPGSHAEVCVLYHVVYCSVVIA